jgi:hypothetical protein
VAGPGRLCWVLALIAGQRARCRAVAGGRVSPGGQGGGQPGEQDVEAAFEFGGAVVGGQDGGQAAEQGEFADRQPVQAEPLQLAVDAFMPPCCPWPTARSAPRSAAAGGRAQPRFGKPTSVLTKRRCQRSDVPAAASRWARSAFGTARAKADKIARSAMTTVVDRPDDAVPRPREAAPGSPDLWPRYSGQAGIASRPPRQRIR